MTPCEANENYYRKVLIGNLNEDEIGKLPPVFDWKYSGIENNDGQSYYLFANENVGMMIYFLYHDTDNIFESRNVLPIDCDNMNKKAYKKGGDPAEKQADDITEDFLYHFCTRFNKAIRSVNEEASSNIWCAIVPSVHDVEKSLK